MHVENETFSFATACVVGLGYIGLPTAATLAACGVDVKGVDINQDIVDKLNGGLAHFSEPDLDELVQRVVTNGKLQAYTMPQSADVFVIAVPTPMLPDKSPDMRHVESATRSLTNVLESGNVVILESTSPVGSTKMIEDIIRKERPDLVDGDALSLSLAYCPERILPGQMVRELIENDRIVGGQTPAAALRASAFYRKFVKGQILVTDARTAELVKLIENAYRDVNIAFANEIANICDNGGMDAWDAIRLANHHPRVNILNPGPGVGGHCIAIDPWFLITQNPGLSKLMAEARRINDERPESVLGKIRHACGNANTRRVACFGLAYKPDVDDLRESPAVKIAGTLADEGFKVLVVEPHITQLPSSLASKSNVKLVDASTAISDDGVIAILVAHSEFSATPLMFEGKTTIDPVGLLAHTEKRA